MEGKFEHSRLKAGAKERENDNCQLLCIVIRLYKMYMTFKHTYLFTNNTHSDMFRLKRITIKLSIEPYIRYIKC